MLEIQLLCIFQNMHCKSLGFQGEVGIAGFGYLFFMKKGN
jgi:hypothetical protein